MELLEYIPTEMFDTTQHIACRGPFLVAKEVLPAMRKRGSGTFLISNNSSSLRGRKRLTGQSLYYPRVMMRTLAQVLTEEYSEHNIHVANVIIDGLIDSPGTRALKKQLIIQRLLWMQARLQMLFGTYTASIVQSGHMIFN